jgi:enoyl-CoA hydratase/carnithine racemase
MDIKQTLTDQLAGASEALKERVVQIQFEKELEKRAAAVIAGLANLDTLNKNLKQLTDKPDVKNFDVNGTKVIEAYSEAAVKSIKQAKEAVDKQQLALADALERNDFKKLFESQN